MDTKFLIDLVHDRKPTIDEIEKVIQEGIETPDIIVDLIKGRKPMEADIRIILKETCESNHSSCNKNCPVFLLNDGRAPDETKNLFEFSGCDCFKDGGDMYKFIKEHSK
jgi:hypothetical protein